MPSPTWRPGPGCLIGPNRTHCLDNRVLQEQAAEALAAGCITDEEYTRIVDSHPVAFYSPNILIRIGLFILTVILAAFSFGLLALLITPTTGHALGGLLIFSGLVCYGVLEAVVYSKHQFQSGVDDALLLMAGILLLSGIYLAVDHVPTLTLFLLIFTVALYSTLRFADQLTALLTYAALLAIVFKVMTSVGGLANTLLPFLIMAISIGIYFLAATLSANPRFRHYHLCTAVVIKVACLLSFYLAGNYFVVREAGIALLDLPLQPGQGLPFGWLFWILTVTTPFAYIAQGLRKKDIIFIWVGLGLIAAAVLTFRNYYHVLPVEWALVLGGTLLIAVSYALIKYLHIPRHGFTGELTDDRHLLQNLHVESLLIAETLSTTALTPSNDFQFGGGSGGGGGAGGEY